MKILQIWIIGFLTLISSTISASSNCSLETVSKGSTYADLYKSSTFKVVAKKDDRLVALGTAFLIDRRGYFLTANHVVDNTNLDGDGWSIELAADLHHGSSAELRIPATHHPTNELTSLDIAVLEGTLSQAYMVNRDAAVAVDANKYLADQTAFKLRFELPDNNEEFEFVGYRNKRNDGTGPLVLESGRFDVRSTPALGDLGKKLLLEGEVFHGHSGSPVIDSEGYVIAVVSNYLVPRNQELKFYQKSEDLMRRRVNAETILLGSNIFGVIAPTENAETLLLYLQRKGAPINWGESLLISKTSLNSLDWITLTKNIMKDPESYIDSLKQERNIVRQIYDSSNKGCLHHLFSTWSAFLSGFQINPQGYDFDSLFASLETKVVSFDGDDSEILKDTEEVIFSYSQYLENFADIDAPNITSRERRELSYRYRELAELQIDAIQRGSERVNFQDVRQNISKSLALNEKEPNSWRTLAQAAYLDSDFDLSVSAVAVANKYAVSDEIIEGTEEDFSRIVGWRSRTASPNVRHRYSDLLEGGINQFQPVRLDPERFAPARFENIEAFGYNRPDSEAYLENLVATQQWEAG